MFLWRASRPGEFDAPRFCLLELPFASRPVPGRRVLAECGFTATLSRCCIDTAQEQAKGASSNQADPELRLLASRAGLARTAAGCRARVRSDTHTHITPDLHTLTPREMLHRSKRCVRWARWHFNREYPIRHIVAALQESWGCESESVCLRDLRDLPTLTPCEVHVLPNDYETSARLPLV